MSSSKEYLDYVLDQLSGLKTVSYRPMMGEYIIYYQGKIIGGIYDDRFLVKQTESAKRLMPDASLELPYEGAKEMILVDGIDDRDFLETLFKEMAAELPQRRKL
ncbi:MAG: TfoX/Sxy family protein [Clostridia bacterium]|nr:TfoX/Sxy family protein [Clostridia bacterium]